MVTVLCVSSSKMKLDWIIAAIKLVQIVDGTWNDSMKTKIIIHFSISSKFSKHLLLSKRLAHNIRQNNKFISLLDFRKCLFLITKILGYIFLCFFFTKLANVLIFARVPYKRIFMWSQQRKVPITLISRFFWENTSSVVFSTSHLLHFIF